VSLADFAVTDLQSRHWNLAAWAGKVVYVNVWATWCIPCRAELPNIQKLHDDLRERADRLVITVNIDDDDDLTRKFMREHNYTFPVVSAQDRGADRCARRAAELADRCAGEEAGRIDRHPMQRVRSRSREDHGSDRAKPR
jgi:thiol-disulfide isomerase/thioredoxin